MLEGLELLELEQRAKVKKGIQLFLAIADNPPYFEINKTYSPKELEIFDALTSRYLRVYEISIQYLKTINLIQSIDKAETFRDLIHQSIKFGYIQDFEIWQEMRLIRNKFTHDYLPHQMKEMFQLICEKFTVEIKYLLAKISQE